MKTEAAKKVFEMCNFFRESFVYKKVRQNKSDRTDVILKSNKKSNKIITKTYCIIEKWVIYYHYSKGRKLFPPEKMFL